MIHRTLLVIILVFVIVIVIVVVIVIVMIERKVVEVILYVEEWKT